MIHQVRNGRHVMKFDGVVLGSASSQRPDAPRWSELVVYGLTNGSYMRSKIGYSAVAHRPECQLVDYRMVPWVDLEDRRESRQERTPCEICQPVLGNPHLMIESTRYTASVARDATHLAEILLQKRRSDQLPRLVARVVEQVCQVDDCFARYWDTLSPVYMNRSG